MDFLLLAIAPAMIFVIFIYLKDKIEKEPISFLIKNFFLGAFGSIIITLILGVLFNSIYPLTDEKSVFQQFIKAFVVVALVEEFSKYVIVKYYAQKNKEFNEPFDGIVYALTVSMGFAALENVLYILQYGVSTGITRAFTAVPAHATFGILMGYFMGKAKFSKNRIQLNLLGLLGATIFHGFYNFFLFINFVPGTLIGAILSLIIGTVLSRKAIKKHQKDSNFKI
ncbi:MULTISPECIES: PrsW family intramembrane metalloprotease [unclassified Polaribacter]|jgi:RsiW-degrading membrane proteinase PrsW (M82 family)|uniref:PrsW family intramembrane metalloprotease n=1 Tax=unclassified Polaribacter TaxID=196858 RepID=UPI00052DB3F9|nr:MULTISPECIES: PrsW family glutamic-type intramembrane protease [unclassified Polaribacter]KGL59687.1 protease prsW family [Polaribacter sp. Hel1_33_49]MBT3742564.1 PrsW family intramembrane metalloprotease [Polaribacter sp.]MBT4413578.1 PrsW family intramembrane metalloprotease [Polaribacter sp.]MDG1195288.1 PrsW family glutamic-type intramembrane protease [Polaribacter sp.]MDG1404127.1 PrsW family glutamic-type intramembrane protease [Polaribacter sp.]